LICVGGCSATGRMLPKLVARPLLEAGGRACHNYYLLPGRCYSADENSVQNSEFILPSHSFR
jgi:hypothetical protein